MKERQLSELKQEIQFLQIERESRITGMEMSIPVNDWDRIEKHAINLKRIDALLLIKNNQSQALVLEIAEEQRQSILEVI
jgi:hypothetical protein